MLSVSACSSSVSDGCELDGRGSKGSVKMEGLKVDISRGGAGSVIMSCGVGVEWTPLKLTGQRICICRAWQAVLTEERRTIRTFALGLAANLHIPHATWLYSGCRYPDPVNFDLIRNERDPGE